MLDFTFNVPLIELIGYLNSLFTVVGLAVRDQKTMRFLILISTMIGLTYGYLLKQNPIMLTNAMILLSNVFLLGEYSGAKRASSETPETDEPNVIK